MGRGTQRERAVKAELESQGWFVVRAPASLGSADLLAARHSRDIVHVTPLAEVLLVQVKSTQVSNASGRKYSPFNSFGPEERAAILRDAEKAGGRATLAYWPPRGKLEWIGPELWPENRQRQEAA